MALSASVVYETRSRGSKSMVVAVSEVIYNGALVGTNAAGLLINWDDSAATLRFEGIANDGANDSVTGSANLEEMVVDDTGAILRAVTVANVTGDQTDVNSAVYASDENTFDVSATTNTQPIGRIVRFVTATTFDVQLLTSAEYEASI